MLLKSFVTVVLCVVIVFLTIENYEAWNRPYKPLPDMVIVPEKSETKKENPPMLASTKDPAPTKSYNLISEKNIFSPERRDFPIPAAATARPIVRPQIILYGVTIFGDYQSASVVNPGRSLRKGERETLTLKLGERVGEYKLAKVLPDRIAMESNGDAFEVLLYDFKNPKKRMEARTGTESAMVASPQPAAVRATPGEALKPAPSQESAERPRGLAQVQAATPLPFNKHTYQLLGPSAATRGGGISYPTGGPPAQESVRK